MKVHLCIFISVVVATKAHHYRGHYHERIGIPLAAKIKAYENKLFANPEMQSRIVGGEPSIDNAYPFMASLRILMRGTLNVSMCAASLVTTSRLVTAGHCVDGAMMIGARLGSNYLFHGGVRYRAKDFSAHPFYTYIPDQDYLIHDIGILRLKREVKLTDRIALISLPRTPNDLEKVGEPAIVAGWGVTSDAQRNSTETFDANWEYSDIVPQIILEETCLREFDSPYLNGTVVCTSGEAGKGTCRGDSGGPLVVLRDIHILVGVSSFGYAECEAGWPSVFTRTEPYKDFIMNYKPL